MIVDRLRPVIKFESTYYFLRTPLEDIFWLPCHFFSPPTASHFPAKGYICGQNWQGKWQGSFLQHQLPPSILNYQTQ